MRRLNRAAAALLVASVTACSPAAATTPTATPTTYQCLDDGRLKAGPCSKADYDQQQKEQALFKEAQRVLTDFEAERNRLMHAGGASEPSESMRVLAENPFLDQIMQFLRDQKDDQLTINGEIRVSHFTIERARTRPGAVFEMRACENATETVATAPDGKKYPPGTIQIVWIYFKSSDSSLKIFDADSESAKTCA